MSEFKTIPLSPDYDRSTFHCGEISLDNYLKKYAGQDLKRKEAAVFISVRDEKIIGFYTLSALQINSADIPEKVLKKLRLSSYPQKPATLLGRLAVDKHFQRQQLGKILLVDALKRSYYQSTQVGSIAVVVDALNHTAVSFYEKFGFIKFAEQHNRLFLPMKTIQRLFI